MTQEELWMEQYNEVKGFIERISGIHRDMVRRREESSAGAGERC